MLENKIIHITSGFDVLKNILSSKSLNLSYSQESFCDSSKTISRAVHPMVCFSEYNIDEIDTKKITYGRYGLGFSKDWARKKKIGPVLYVSQNSLAAKGMSKLLIARRNLPKSKLPKNLRLAIIELKCFMKNEQGYNSHFGVDNFDFKSENEWRYVPEKRIISNFHISQKQNVYEMRKDEYNRRLLEYPLKFKLSDIEVIFVTSEQEVIEIARTFRIDKGRIKISGWEYNKLKKITHNK